MFISITGRAGLRRCRYQSDNVDNANGPPVGNCNRSLRAAILRIAENLIRCNHHFQHMATLWASQGKDARDLHVRVGLRFCRIAFQMVAGRQVFRHPCIRGRHYILDKLNAFHREDDTGMAEVLRDLQAAVGQLPPCAYAAEAKPLAEELQRIRDGNRRGPQVLGDILPIVFYSVTPGGKVQDIGLCHRWYVLDYGSQSDVVLFGTTIGTGVATYGRWEDIGPGPEDIAPAPIQD